MTSKNLDLELLLGEYRTLVQESQGTDGEIEWERLRGALIVTGEWTAVGAQHLVDLVRGHGGFFLRNAAALAVAVGVEDGELGL